MLTWLLMLTRLTHLPSLSLLHLSKDSSAYTIGLTYVTLVLRLDAATDAAVAAVAAPAAVADTVDLVSAVVAEVCIIACSC